MEFRRLIQLGEIVVTVIPFFKYSDILQILRFRKIFFQNWVSIEKLVKFVS